MDTKLRQQIANTLRRGRQARRWTQAELAEKLGLSQSRLSEIESGQGSLSAEQFITLLKLFNLLASQFIKAKTNSKKAQLQKAIARLGGSQLKEDPDLLPSEKLSEVYNVILETIIEGDSARLLTALTPVIILHAKQIPIGKISLKLEEYHIENRFYWILDGVLRAINQRGKTDVPHDKSLIYRRAKTILENVINFRIKKSMVLKHPEDVLDSDIISIKTLSQLRESRDPLAKRWNIITRIREEDFYNALLESEKNG